MAPWEGEGEVVRRVSRIADHVAGIEEAPGRHPRQLLPMHLMGCVTCQNCSNTLNSVRRRCDNRLLFARQGSTSQACFMQQVSVTQGLKVGSCLQQNCPSSSSFSGIGSSCYEHSGEPQFARPTLGNSNIPNLKKEQPITQECVESSAEPPRFARPSTGVTGVCGKQLSCNRTAQTVSSGGREWTPRMDVAETGQYYVVMLELPGANINDIKVEVDDKNLTVTGKCSAPRSGVANCSEDGNMTYLQREIFQGPYLVAWLLPNDVNKDSVSAELLKVGPIFEYGSNLSVNYFYDGEGKLPNYWVKRGVIDPLDGLQQFAPYKEWVPPGNSS